jgi:3-hydroxyacyl-[acyl-carrier-protein] dehydratase
MQLDRVVRLEPGKRGCAIRNVTNTLSILDSHFPRFPVMPGVLILGSMGELAARVLQEQTGATWRMVGAERVRFRHFVQPGDQMELTVEVTEITAGHAVCRGTVEVAGRLVTTARALRLACVETGRIGANP